MKLKDVVKDFLNTKNTHTYCTCGNRQSHSLIWCSQCGKNFKKSGYKPITIGDKIKWLDGKPNRVERPRYCAAIILRECRKKLENEKISIKEIEEEIKNQLNI